MTVADILERAADLIEPEGAWIRGASARDQDGRRTIPSDPTATCFCASGAICRIAEDYEEQQAATKFVNRLLRAKVWNWNDRARRTQAEVVAKLREAAQVARGLILRGRG